jgi:hypothetical protein
MPVAMPLASAPRFDVLADTRPDDHTLPAFMVSTSRGFLPRQDPIVRLPAEFDALESLLSRMPIETAAGTPGLLATFTLGEHVLRELPDLTAAVEKYAEDLPLMNALYRDYSFLASAYLLEPCHERFVRGEGYGLGRQSLPSTIALPIVRVAEMQVSIIRVESNPLKFAELPPAHPCAPTLTCLLPRAVSASSPSWNMPARMPSSITALRTHPVVWSTRICASSAPLSSV